MTRATPVMDIAAVRSILMTARFALQSIDHLVVIGAG
jgi:hypothetical protein